ncbi:MAG: hypothetical protein NT039_01860 [Candidatus Berkelbacteria bacterium]|nr:hypothetical protein [Candidatus Berkelbacteria bacterium]
MNWIEKEVPREDNSEVVVGIVVPVVVDVEAVMVGVAHVDVVAIGGLDNLSAFIRDTRNRALLPALLV